MLRIGQYDAFDKWDILCRYWKDNASVADIGTDKFERPRLPRWHGVALSYGHRACVNYLRAKVDGLEVLSAPASAATPRGNGAVPHTLNAAFAQLLLQGGYDGLDRIVRNLVATIIQAGFDAPFDGSLPPAFTERIHNVFKAGALRGLQWTDEEGEVPTIEVLRREAGGGFPKEAARDKKNVLSLFSAWFCGRNDVIHIYDAWPDQVTLVDLHQRSLDDMKLVYPRDWTYICQDYAEFLRRADERGLSFDLIVSDPFREDCNKTAWDLLPLIMRLCGDTYVTNYFDEMFGELRVASDDCAGLSHAIRAKTAVEVEVTEAVRRGPDVFWVVMRKPNRVRKSSESRQDAPLELRGPRDAGLSHAVPLAGERK